MEEQQKNALEEPSVALIQNEDWDSGIIFSLHFISHIRITFRITNRNSTFANQYFDSADY